MRYDVSRVHYLQSSSKEGISTATKCHSQSHLVSPVGKKNGWRAMEKQAKQSPESDRVNRLL
jgi:hypothetical protein